MYIIIFKFSKKYKFKYNINVTFKININIDGFFQIKFNSYDLTTKLVKLRFKSNQSV